MLIILVFLTSLVCAIILTYVSIYIAYRLQICDAPGAIKIHDKPIPRFGGLGIVLGTVAGFLFMNFLIEGHEGIIGAIVSGGLIIALTGALDDILNLRPWQKIIGQSLGAVTFVILHPMFLFNKGNVTVSSVLIGILTVLFIMFITNSINLLDGMDGLAASTCIIMTIYFGIVLFMIAQNELVFIAAALVGGCLGFLLYNYPPAKTFMGDIGSLFLGYMLAIVSIQVLLTIPTSVSQAVGVLLILIVPVIDTLLAIFRRLRNNQHVFTGDRKHFYDCFRQLFGMHDWITLLVMWSITTFCGMLGLVAYFSNTFVACILAFTVIFVLISLAVKIGSLDFAANEVTIQENRSKSALGN